MFYAFLGGKKPLLGYDKANDPIFAYSTYKHFWKQISHLVFSFACQFSIKSHLIVG